MLLVLLVLLLRGKDETPDIKDRGTVLRDSSIQTLRLPTSIIDDIGVTNVKITSWTCFSH